jgi:thymidylate kinase
VSPASSAADALVLPARLERLFAAFTEAGLRWSLLRPLESLPELEGDVDVLVAPVHAARVPELVAAEGFLVIRMAGPDLHAADFDEQTRRFLWIHVQSELSLARTTIPAASVLADAVPGKVPRPEDSWLLWILLLRALVDKGGLAPRHREAVFALAGRVLSPPPELAAIAERHGLSPAVVQRLAATGDWAALDRQVLPESASPRRRRLTRAAVGRRLQQLREPRGLSVAVVGPDGAGKTTLVEALDRQLPFPSRRHYMGLTGGRMPRAEALRVPGLVLAARLAILWGRFARSEYDRRLGRIVLIDRYTLDGAVPSGVPLRPLAQLSRRLQRRACPMPDLVLLLDASGATMHARKGEYDPETLETWRVAYGRLVGTVAQLEVLDAEQPADEVLRQAQASIWRRYRRRLEEGRR